MAAGAPPRLGVVVVAAGSGERLGSGGPKALVELAGRPLLAHALAGLAAAGLPPAVVVHPPGAAEAVACALDGLPVAARVPGGATRTDSVRAGVAALADDVEVVVVHDAARPLTPPAVIAAAVAAVTGPAAGIATADAAADATGAGEPVLAAAPALALVDTLKRVEGDQVVATVDRAGLVGVQTPQVFPRAVLERALAPDAQAGEATDDLALVERLRDRGELAGRIVTVPGSEWGRKVTYPHDLAFLALLAAHAAPTTTDAEGAPW